jgi:hypothetical protein
MITPNTTLSFLCFAALALVGCEHTYQEVPVSSNASRPKLKTEVLLYVPIPPDGRFKKDFVVDSGTLTAVAVRDAFAKYVKRAYLGRRVESFEESLETARNHNCAYVVYSRVLRWEDRATEFSGRTDKIEIRIEVADSASGEILHATILKGRSRWLTDGGDSPKDLLLEPIKNYAASLFQPVSRPSGLRSRPGHSGMD